MADSRSGARGVPEEPRAFRYTKKCYQRLLGSHQQDSGPNTKSLPVAKTEQI